MPEAPSTSATAAAAPAARTFEGVQILRGIAASMVVFHHMCIVVNENFPGGSALATYYGLAHVGASGVDIFFCISGLVIAHAARSLPPGTGVARSFAWKRILRVLPPYWIFTLALLLLWATGIGLRNLNVTPALVATSFLLIPYPKTTTFGDYSLHPILDVGWTLTFEMYFYAVCTVVIAFVGGRRIWPVALGALGVLALAAWAIGGTDTIAASVMVSPLLLEFMAGVALARYVAGRTSRPLGWLLIAAGTAGLVGSIYLPNPGAWRALIWGVPGVMLVAGGVLLPVTLSGRGTRFLSFLGLTSYTIYLVHPFFMVVAGTLLKHGSFRQVPADPLLLALTVVGIFGSAATYFLVEGPLIQLLKPRSRTAAEARMVVGA
jgi:peptidoglycan/LPS O-acetylase OafA/YrhL